MANIIQIKRSLTTVIPTTLAEGELAYSEDAATKLLYIGTNAGASIEAIGGKSIVDKVNTIAPNSTVNSTDVFLLNRANHTGAQLLATISDSGTAASKNAPVTGNAIATEVVLGNDSRLGAIWAVRSAAHTAVSGDGIFADTSVGPFSVTLPILPVIGDSVYFDDNTVSWGTNNLTVLRNGHTIDGSATDFVADVNGASFALVYDGVDWNILNYQVSTGATTANVVTSNTSNVFTAAQSISPIALTDAITITINALLSNNFTVILAGNRTLGLPTNLVAGQSGSIKISQDLIGTRILTYNTVWKFAGGVIPQLTVTANAVDRLDYFVWSPTEIHASLALDVK